MQECIGFQKVMCKLATLKLLAYKNTNKYYRFIV